MHQKHTGNRLMANQQSGSIIKKSKNKGRRSGLYVLRVQVDWFTCICIYMGWNGLKIKFTD